jgi:hypothetical protein
MPVQLVSSGVYAIIHPQSLHWRQCGFEGKGNPMTYTKQEMYDCLFKTVYLTMVEQFLANLKQAPEGMFFAETDLDQLVDLSHQARMIADVGTDIHALGLVDKDHPSRNRRQKRTS